MATPFQNVMPGVRVERPRLERDEQPVRAPRDEARMPQRLQLEELVVEDIRSTRDARSQLKERIVTRERLYNSDLPQRQYSGRANIRIPFPYVWAESMVPRYMASVLGGKNVMEVIARPHVDPMNAQFAKRLMNYQLLFEMFFPWEAFTFFKTIASKGLAVQKIRWNVKQQSPEIFLIHPEDYVQDPRASLPKKATWKGHLVAKTKEELNEGVRDGRYFKDAVDEVTADPPKTDLGRGIRVSVKRGVYFCWEIFLTFRLRGQDIALIALVAEEKEKLLGFTESPYGEQDPFIGYSDVPDPFSFQSAKSEMDTIQSMYEAASDIINQRLDNVTQEINGLYTVRKASGINRNRLMSAPWGVIDVGDHDDIRPLQKSFVTGNAYQEVGSLNELMKLATGLIDQQRGVDKPSVDTATGMNLLLAQANMRPGLKVQLMQYVYLAELGRKVLFQDQRFMSLSKAVHIIGDQEGAVKTIMVPPESIEGQFDLMPVGFAISGQRDVRAGMLINFLNVLRGFPGTNPGEVLREAAIMLEIRNPDAITGAGAPAGQALRQQAVDSFDQTLAGAQMRGPQGQQGVANVAGAIPGSAPAVAA